MVHHSVRKRQPVKTHIRAHSRHNFDMGRAFKRSDVDPSLSSSRPASHNLRCLISSSHDSWRNVLLQECFSPLSSLRGVRASLPLAVFWVPTHCGLGWQDGLSDPKQCCCRVWTKGGGGIHLVPRASPPAPADSRPQNARRSPHPAGGMVTK